MTPIFPVSDGGGFDHLSDREILLLTAQGLRNLAERFDQSQTTQFGRCTNHAKRIETLETWRTGLAGGWAALLAYIKFKGGGGG